MFPRRLLTPLLAVALLLPRPAYAEPPTRGDVWLASLGSFPQDLSDAVDAALTAELQVHVHRDAPPLPLPKSAWYAPRKRWRAERLLAFLPGALLQAAAGKILGLTTQDISTTKDDHPDWGVFGLGDMPGAAAVVSTHRLTHNVDHATLTRRLTIIATHEVGHTFGLPHCTETGCVMLDAEGGIANTDTGTGHLGPGCRALLDSLAPVR